MGFSRKRKGRDGRLRWTGYYRNLQGLERSAGTYAKKADADAAWQEAEANIRAGLRYDPSRGRQTFGAFVEMWRQTARLELSTKADYNSALDRHLLPFFGAMRLRDIGTEQVRQWVAEAKANGVSARRVQYCVRSVLGSVFTMALDDGIIIVHPCHRVAVDPVPRKPRRIVTAAQFDAVYDALLDSDARLLVETAIETGLRWGELTELRVRDIDFVTRVLTVSRAVIWVSRKHNPEGGFVVKDYPKDGEWRQLGLSVQIIDKITAHIEEHRLGWGDLLFARRTETVAEAEALPDPQTLGWTEPNDTGRTYRHGTTTAYGLGRCRCEHCRRAVTLYRAERRAAGKDRPPKGPKRVVTDQHIHASTFRNGV